MRAIVQVSKSVTIAYLHYTKHDFQQHKSILRSTMFIYLLSYSRYAITTCEQKNQNQNKNYLNYFTKHTFCNFNVSLRSSSCPRPS